MEIFKDYILIFSTTLIIEIKPTSYFLFYRKDLKINPIGIDRYYEHYGFRIILSGIVDLCFLHT